jgi:hypothetical protein
MVKAKATAKKKTVAKKGKLKPISKTTSTKKQTKAASGKKPTIGKKKAKKVAKPTAKKKKPVKVASKKKKAVAKKSVPAKTKATPKKKEVRSVVKAKGKKPVKKKPAVQKKKTSITKKKVQSSSVKKAIAKNVRPSTPAAQRVATIKEPLLSANERYNIGGLFACAIERRNDPDCSRLRAVLRHLALSSQEKDNLIRLSEGFMIPKLFAENLPEPKVNQLLADLVKFGMKQGSYENYWREAIQQIGFWLGIFPAQFQAIEQQVKR